jgi:hypothetical protein
VVRSFPKRNQRQYSARIKTKMAIAAEVGAESIWEQNINGIKQRG